MPSVLALAGLLALLMAAVVTDLRSRRIANDLILSGVALALACHAVAMGLGRPALAGPAWWAPAAGMAAGFAALMPLYLLRACGAGDIKLMAMVGAFIGVPAVLWAALFSLLAGGLLSLVFLLFRGVAARTLANLSLMFARRMPCLRGGPTVQAAPLDVTAAGLPYGVAIAAGTLWSVLRTGLAA